MPRGQRKPACKRGHVNPERSPAGACIPCRKIYYRETYERDRAQRIAYAIRRAQNNPEARRDEQRAFRLGVPVADVRAAIARAAGHCEACSTTVTHASLVVDHDHASGHVRGVLCRFCNALEGMLNKQADRVAKLRGYLDREIARRTESAGG